MAKGMPMFSLADTTHPPRGMTPWDRNTSHCYYYVVSGKTDLKHTANHRAQSPTTFLHFLMGAKRRCSGSPWGGCWSTCCSQSFSSRSLHSRARSCLWWWRIFVPRKTMKAAVSQSCGAERNQRLPVFSGQKGEISRPCSSHNATQQHLSLTMSSQGYGLDSRRLILV